MRTIDLNGLPVPLYTCTLDNPKLKREGNQNGVRQAPNVKITCIVCYYKNKFQQIFDRFVCKLSKYMSKQNKIIRYYM